MPLPGPVGQMPGGLLWLEYVNPTMGERHQLFFHVAWFDQAPVGVSNDYVYTGSGPVAPSESGVLATFAVLAGLWAPYYSPDWHLHIDSLSVFSPSGERPLPDTPVATPVAGTMTSSTVGLVSTRRDFKLLGRQAARRTLHLAQIYAAVLGTQVAVGTAGGGYDARDQAWMRYLSGQSGGGAVLQDGTYAFPDGDVASWWARRLEPLPGGSGGSGTSFTGDCLVWPLGAAICNPSGDVVTLDTPGGHFLFNDTGLTIPGGHRLETV